MYSHNYENTSFKRLYSHAAEREAEINFRPHWLQPSGTTASPRTAAALAATARAEADRLITAILLGTSHTEGAALEEIQICTFLKEMMAMDGVPGPRGRQRRRRPRRRRRTEGAALEDLQICAFRPHEVGQ